MSDNLPLGQVRKVIVNYWFKIYSILTPGNHNTRGKFLYKYNMFLNVTNNNINTIGGNEKMWDVYKWIGEAIPRLYF